VKLKMLNTRLPIAFDYSTAECKEVGEERRRSLSGRSRKVFGLSMLLHRWSVAVDCGCMCIKTQASSSLEKELDNVTVDILCHSAHLLLVQLLLSGRRLYGPRKKQKHVKLEPFLVEF